jgi:hypothetical protein
VAENQEPSLGSWFSATGYNCGRHRTDHNSVSSSFVGACPLLDVSTCMLPQSEAVPENLRI